jgi:hypothetical protein
MHRSPPRKRWVADGQGIVVRHNSVPRRIVLPLVPPSFGFAAVFVAARLAFAWHLFGISSIHPLLFSLLIIIIVMIRCTGNAFQPPADDLRPLNHLHPFGSLWSTPVIHSRIRLCDGWSRMKGRRCAAVRGRRSSRRRRWRFLRGSHGDRRIFLVIGVVPLVQRHVKPFPTFLFLV